MPQPQSPRESRWIQRCGFLEQTMGKPDEDGLEDGRQSRQRKYRKVVRERPGLAPGALFQLIGHTVFLRLSDVASELPSYDEQVLLSSMDTEEDYTGYSQRSAYDEVFATLRAALAAGCKRELGRPWPRPAMTSPRSHVCNVFRVRRCRHQRARRPSH